MFDKNSGLSIYNSIVRNSRLMIELALCSQRDDLNGIYLAPSYKNPQTWFGLIFVRYGIYSSAAYRFMLIMGDDYYDPSMMDFPVKIEEYEKFKRQKSSEDFDRKFFPDNDDEKEMKEEEDEVVKQEKPTKHSNSDSNPTNAWNLPRIFFYAPTKPYHPHVDPVTGELNLSWYFKAWDEKRHHIWHCLKLLRHIFYNKLSKNDLHYQGNRVISKDSVDTTTSEKTDSSSNLKITSSSSPTLFNQTAATLYEENPSEYAKIVKYNIEQTRIELNTAPTLTEDYFEPNYSDLAPDAYKVQKNKMLVAGEKQKLTGWQAQNAQTSGHSFIMPGTIRPFSKV